MTEKQDLEGGDPNSESMKQPVELPVLPKPLTLEEKKYLLAVERGDKVNVRRILQKAHRRNDVDMNCVDALGRGALTLAIDGENLEMVELLVVMGVETRDALLQAINAEFVEAVELLLEHEELIHKPGEPYIVQPFFYVIEPCCIYINSIVVARMGHVEKTTLSHNTSVKEQVNAAVFRMSWQKVDPNTAMFTRDITPLMLAAHKNNYEIIKLLLDRGATLPDPHDIRCGCDECIRNSTEDSLRHTLARLNEYRALASPSLIALSSTDPILTAFELSWELRNLAFAEQESKSEYLELRRQVQRFAVDLLDQSRSSQELAVILNHDPTGAPFIEGEHMKLSRLELAINFKQKKFVAHPNIQQLLASIWYEGVPGFRRKSAIAKIMILIRVAFLFPFYCSMYMISPNCKIGKLIRKPFMKFLIHASSYLFFLLILILVSQRAEVQLVQVFGSEQMIKDLNKELLKQRGNAPTYLEIAVFIYVLGFIWEETQEIYVEGIRSYLRNLWNFIDFTRNSLYVAVALLRFVAYLQQTAEIKKNPQTRFIPREQWDAFDPQLIAEGLFAAANIFSALKLLHLFSINPHLGPLQISLGRMVIDIVKFFFIYTLVLFAFACGLNQLLWYFADLEKRKCYILPGGLPDWDHAGDSCMKWRSFGNVFEASQSLFWASFGLVGLESFELAGIKSYTRFWGLLMFGSYSVINVIVLLNLLIAMMSNSYAMIDKHSDVEWKFARARLWMSYFEENATLPPPFNIFPTPKLFCKLSGLRQKDKLRKMKLKEQKEKEQYDIRYIAVMRALVWRYVSSTHRKMDEEPVTEENINELKSDVSALRYELLEVFEKNGMDVSFTDRKEKTVLAKRTKIWERRLMKDFQVAPVPPVDDDERHETALARFRRIAKMAISSNSNSMWDKTLAGVGISTQIGRCRTRQSFKNQQNLQRAMDEARKLVTRSPLPEVSRGSSPIDVPLAPGNTLLELIKDISTEVRRHAGNVSPLPNSPWKGPGDGPTLGGFLSPSVVPNRASSPVVRITSPASANASRSISPVSRSPSSRPLSPASDLAPRVARSDTTSLRTRTPSPSDVTQKSKLSETPTGLNEQVDNETKEDIALARPVVSEIKPTEGALPPPPAKPKTSVTPIMEVTPSSPSIRSVAQSTPKNLSTVNKTPSFCKPRHSSPRPSSLQPRSAAPYHSSTSSTEHLITSPGPKTLRPSIKIDDVNSIKRQPKTGWL